MWERSGRVLDSRSKGCEFKPHRDTVLCPGVRLIDLCLVLDGPRKTCPHMTEMLTGM